MHLFINGKGLRTLMLTIILVGTNIDGLSPEFVKNTTLLDTSKFKEKIKSGLPFWLRYGVVLGMVLVESYIAENYAYYSPQSATVEVLKKLFNTAVPGLRVPDLTNKPGRFLSLEAIGKILRLIYQAKHGGLESSEKYKKLTGKDALADGLNGLQTDVWESAKKNKLASSTDISATNLKNIYKAFVKDLLDALDECNYWGKNSMPLYPENLVLYFIYAFVNKKAQQKDELKKFFKGLCQGDLENTNPSLKSSWSNEKFDSEEVLKHKNDSKSLLSKRYLLSDENLEELLAVGVLTQWSASRLPPLFEYGEAKSGVVDGVHFPDCFESALRNLFNIVAYDEKTKLFSAEKLKSAAPKLLNEVLDFYKDFAGKKGGELLHSYVAADLQDALLRTAWLDRVIKKNIPYFMYIDLYNKKGKRVYEAPLKKGPFVICLPDGSPLLENKNPGSGGFYENVLTIGDKIYHAFTPSSGLFGYELVPYTYNFIVIMNHLLGLDLFKDVDLGKELLTNDFEARYISTMKNIKPFEGIVYKKYDFIDELELSFAENRTFIVQIDKGQHTSIKLPFAGGHSWSIDLFNKIVNPEAMVFLCHAFNFDASGLGKLKALNQPFWYRGDWSLNSAKILGVDQLIERISLDQQNKKLYVGSIKLIMTNFHLVEGDIGDIQTLMDKVGDGIFADKEITDAIIVPLFPVIDVFNGCAKWLKNDARWNRFDSIVNLKLLFVAFEHRLASLNSEDAKALLIRNNLWLVDGIRNGSLEGFEQLCNQIIALLPQDQVEKFFLRPDLFSNGIFENDGRLFPLLVSKTKQVVGLEKARELLLEKSGSSDGLWFKILHRGSSEMIKNFVLGSKPLLTNEMWKKNLVQVNENGENLIMSLVQCIPFPTEAAMRTLLKILQEDLSKEEFAQQLCLQNKQGMTPYTLLLNVLDKMEEGSRYMDEGEGVASALIESMSKFFTKAELIKTMKLPSPSKGMLIFSYDSGLRLFNLLMQLLNEKEKATLFLDAKDEVGNNILMCYMSRFILYEAYGFKVFEALKKLPKEVQTMVLKHNNLQGENILMHAALTEDIVAEKLVLEAISSLALEERIALFEQKNNEGYNALGFFFWGARGASDPKQFMNIFLTAMDPLPGEARKKIASNEKLLNVFALDNNKNPELVMLVKEWAKKAGV